MRSAWTLRDAIGLPASLSTTRSAARWRWRQAGDYVIELTALNGTGFKGDCNFADANTGEIRVSGLNAETQVWRHREGAGSQALIIVSTGVPQPFTIVPAPPDAAVRFTVGPERVYQPGIELVAGEYRVEVSAPGYKSREVAVAHGSAGPTRHEVTLERTFKPGDVFADALASGGEGPQMVVIPAGSFRMGCLSGDRWDCYNREKPVRTVTIEQSIAVSKYELTFEAWDRCVASGGCGDYRPEDSGWGRGSRPVVNVSWNDAQLYVSWLSSQTGEVYRLLSEAEWEYAARAGSSTRFSWGDRLEADQANYGGDRYDEWETKTAPVGSYSPNEFGLYDMHGNVYEWVQDCWNETYRSAPTDGSAWSKGDCAKRVIRGQGFPAYPLGDDFYSVANRYYSNAEDRGSYSYSAGLRVARRL